MSLIGTPTPAYVLIIALCLSAAITAGIALTDRAMSKRAQRRALIATKVSAGIACPRCESVLCAYPLSKCG